MRKFFIAAAMAVVALFASTRSVEAAFKMTLSDSDGNSLVINDNNSPLGTGVDSASALGTIVYIGNLGAFDINVMTGTSNAPGTPNLAQLTINNLSISSVGFTGDKTVTVALEDTGFFSPTGSGGLESQVSTTQLPANSNVTFQSFLNGNPGTPLALNTVGGTRVNDAVNITSTPFTLENITTYTIHGQGTGTTLTVQTTGLTAVANPAPAGVVLALTGLPVMAFGLLRRRLKKA